MPFRQILGAFVHTSLFVLGASVLTASADAHDTAHYSFSTAYTPETEEPRLPDYLPI